MDKSSKRVKKDPSLPKRPITAYMLWLSENRSRLTKPGMSVTDVAKAAGEEWRKLQDKSKWETESLKDRDRYNKEMELYNKQKQNV